MASPDRIDFLHFFASVVLCGCYKPQRRQHEIALSWSRSQSSAHGREGEMIMILAKRSFSFLINNKYFFLLFIPIMNEPLDLFSSCIVINCHWYHIQ